MRRRNTWNSEGLGSGANDATRSRARSLRPGRGPREFPYGQPDAGHPSLEETMKHWRLVWVFCTVTAFLVVGVAFAADQKMAAATPNKVPAPPVPGPAISAEE